MRLGRSRLGRASSAWVCLAMAGFSLGKVGLGSEAWAQAPADGAIGGQVQSAAGAPVAGALVVARELETGLARRAGAERDGWGDRRGQVLSAAGKPIAGALVVVRGSETGLSLDRRARGRMASFWWCGFRWASTR